MEKKILLLLIVLSLVSAFTACGREVVSYNVEWDIPTGFSTSSADNAATKIYVAQNYSMDKSNITFGKSKDDPQGLDYTKESLETMLKTYYKTIYNSNVELTVTSLEKVERDNCQGIKAEVKATIVGVEAEQILYMFDAKDCYYTICYTCPENSEYREAFEKSAESIKLVPVYE